MSARSVPELLLPGLAHVVMRHYGKGCSESPGCAECHPSGKLSMLIFNRQAPADHGRRTLTV
ncbi:MAG: hypothetical protein J5878_00495 [Oscillospiraceae bacterium]|nr:hypothetical protein [Oscillospiraceae bacterium]